MADVSVLLGFLDLGVKTQGYLSYAPLLYNKLPMNVFSDTHGRLHDVEKTVV